MSLGVSGSHIHPATGEVFTYTVNYLLHGTLLDWTAQVASGALRPATLAGSIRLSRGQTRGLAPTLVTHMVIEAIDKLQATPAAA